MQDPIVIRDEAADSPATVVGCSVLPDKVVVILTEEDDSEGAVGDGLVTDEPAAL